MKLVETLKEAGLDDFKKHSRYTITHVVAVNWKIDHIALFQFIKFPKLLEDPLKKVKRANVKLPKEYNGSILQIKYKDLYKNVHVRGYGCTDEQSQGCFGNGASIVMYIDKIIVLKVPSQGKIQLTGCKSESQVRRAIYALWDHIQRVKKDHPEVAQLPVDEAPRFIWTTVMNNINLNVGFKINKRKIHTFLYKESEFSITANDNDYAGVTAKLEVEGLQSLPMKKYRYIKGSWYSSNADWIDFLVLLTPKDRAKEIKKGRYHTFLIFHSGKIIQTGPRYELMEDVYKYFITMLLNNRASFEDTTPEYVKVRKNARTIKSI